MARNNICCIYLIKDPKDMSIRYVGQTIHFSKRKRVFRGKKKWKTNTNNQKIIYKICQLENLMKKFQTKNL